MGKGIALSLAREGARVAIAGRRQATLDATVKEIEAAGSEGLEPPPYCAGKSQVIPIEGGGKPVGAGRLARAAGDAAAFRASPDFDGTVLAAAAGTTLLATSTAAVGPWHMPIGAAQALVVAVEAA